MSSGMDEILEALDMNQEDLDNVVEKVHMIISTTKTDTIKTMFPWMTNHEILQVLVLTAIYIDKGTKDIEKIITRRYMTSRSNN